MTPTEKNENDIFIDDNNNTNPSKINVFKPRDDVFEEIESDNIVYKDFDDMKLNDDLVRGIYAYGFNHPSAIQSRAIIPIIEGNEIIAQAQSGTGKTGTFSIAILQKINKNIQNCQAVVLAPTRELATQIKDVFRDLSAFLNYKIALCVGGIEMKKNIEDVTGAHIIVGTPGRVFDLLKRPKIVNTKYIKMFVLDEADEMLTGDFKSQIRDIISLLMNKIQICIFSATITEETIETSKFFMKNPLKILVKKEKLSLAGIKQFSVNVEVEEYKLETLIELYGSINIGQSMIYVNTKQKANFLQENLFNEKFVIGVIHSDMSSTERSDVIKLFRSGKLRILISTDLLARGIDVQQVSIVINYDIPNNYENYLHRIGRGGRYGKRGTAINFLTIKDKQKIADIQNNYNIVIEPLPKNYEEIL